MRIGGASREQIKEDKGALSYMGVFPYDHLSEAEHKDIGNLIIKGINMRQAVLKGEDNPTPDNHPPAINPTE